MGRRPKQADGKPSPLIPLAPINYNGDLTIKEQDCLAWHVLSKCSQQEAFVMFLHPELSASPAIAHRLSREFFGSAQAIAFVQAYSDLIKEFAAGGVSGGTSTSKSSYRTDARSKERKSGETDDEYKARCKKEAAESIIDKIIDRVDDVEDIDGLLDTIKAMEKTGFFDNNGQSIIPPVRYLPETCSECRYKKFIDEQMQIKNIVTL